MGNVNKPWMHNGSVMLDGRKMSKSEGNFVTMNELLRTEAQLGRRHSSSCHAHDVLSRAAGLHRQTAPRG
ncbi:hypothetical protein GOB57_09140 [Sinorhizobium meliloti]|nr:hypothetical protein [Sinorhizobium meliloti]